MIARQRLINGLIVWGIWNTQTEKWELEASELTSLFMEKSDCECAIKMYQNNGLLGE